MVVGGEEESEGRECSRVMSEAIFLLITSESVRACMLPSHQTLLSHKPQPVSPRMTKLSSL